MIKFDDDATNKQLEQLYNQEQERLVADRANHMGLGAINLQGYTINPTALSKIKEEDSLAGNIVGFEINRNFLSVALTDPNNVTTQSIIKKLESDDLEVTVFLCSKKSLDHAQKRYKDIRDSNSDKFGVFEINKKDISDLVSIIKGTQDIKKLIDDTNSLGNLHRTTETLEIIFSGAIALRASDIHIEPEKKVVRIRYRFDGLLHDITNIDSYVYGRIRSRIKILSGLILNKRAEAQDGRFSLDIGDRQLEIRTSIIPGDPEESIVMRLLDPAAASFRIENINLNEQLYKIIKRELKKPNGLIVTTGPTGSGKTTALYSFLKEVLTEGVKIITIENPVEYKLDGIVQTQVGEDYTFSSGLRAILRQDPDIILIGEIRDKEVANTAIHAAQTGHLVFSTLHTNTAVAAFVRLIDLGIDPRVMGTSINLILGQRLVRKLCEKCKLSYAPSPDEQKIIEHVMNNHPQPIPLPNPITLYRPVGCSHCDQTGFSGRNGIYEAVVMDEAVEEVVLRDPRESAILAAARPQMIPTMTEDGMVKVIQGITSIAELERVIELPYVNQSGEIVTPQPVFIKNNSTQ